MPDILDRIVAAKRQETAERRRSVPMETLEKMLSGAPRVRDFRAALEQGPGLGIIAEVKKASPSAGVLRADFDPVAIARNYESAGVNAVSVLTDEPFFQGRLSYLGDIRRAVALPLLRKDFILDAYQVVEARVAGADAVLLIAEILSDTELPALQRAIESHGMQALVELYEPDNLPRVLDAGASLIGVNNRNLRTFETRLEHTLELMPRMPRDACVVSESGIQTRTDMQRLEAAGVKAVLIGETLMRSDDVRTTLHALRGG
ncbi:MAG: indole-3-glycerol phosphate synthase TrpC [Gemmataceae bacterium]|nr:indole-3-glycerol phosphate synthase TrpC [Gemmataceae bacterium]MCI0737455.1 indole-3-glycerol phosphate synthase TrpC [Gemmataceae bacterium]